MTYAHQHRYTQARTGGGNMADVSLHKAYVYCCTDDSRKLKKNGLQLLKECHNVYWQQGTNQVNPVITLGTLGDVSKFAKANYVYLPDFRRYYFGMDFKAMPGNIIQMPLHSDVLMSFRQYIANLTAYIERQENLWNRYMIDELLPTRTERIITVKKIGNIGNPSGSYIALTTTGGK